MHRSFSNLVLRGWLIMLILVSSSFVSAEFTSISLAGRLAGSTLEHQVNLDDPNANGLNTITIRYTVPKSCWLAVGISPDGSMIGSEVIIGKPIERSIRKHKLTGKSAEAIIQMQNSGLINATFAQSGGITTLTYTKILVEDGELAINPNGPNTFVAAYGKNNTFGYHEGSGSFVVNLVTDGIEPTTSAPVAPTVAPVDGFRQIPLAGALAATNFQYRLNRDDETVSIRFTCPGTVWVGVGVSRDFGTMIPAKSVIGFPASGEAPLQYWMQARELSGVVPLSEQVLTDPQITVADDETTLSYTIPIYSAGMTDDTLEIRADGRSTNFIIACGFNAGQSFHKLIGSIDTVIEDGNGPIPAPVPFPSPTEAPAQTSTPVLLPSTDSPVMSPTTTNAPAPSAPTPIPASGGGFRQIPFSGSLAEDPFEYRLNRNDANANGEDTISIRFTCPGNVWVGVGVSREYGTMIPSKSVMGFPGSGNPPVQYLMEARNVSFVNPLPDDQQVLIDPQITFANDKTTLSYTIPIYNPAVMNNTTYETLEIRADGRLQSFIIACGLNEGPSFHRITGSLSAQLQDGTAPPTSTPVSAPTDAPVMGPSDSPVTTNAPVTAAPIATESPSVGATLTDAPVLLAPTPDPPTPTNTPVSAPVTTESPIGPVPTDAPAVLTPTGPTPTGVPLPTSTGSPVLSPTTTTDSPAAATPTDIPVVVPTNAPTLLSASLAASGNGRITLSGFAFLIIMMGVAL